MFQTWIAAGLATADLGDGAWGWTKQGKELPREIRTLLVLMLAGQCKRELADLYKTDLAKLGFDENGFYLLDDYS